MEREENFKNKWFCFHGECVPIPFVFKYELKSKWVRFHSLMHNKRYAQNLKELSEIVRKNHYLMKEIIGDYNNAFVVLATPNYEIRPKGFNFNNDLNETQKSYTEICNKIIEKFSLCNEFKIVFDEMPYSINSALIKLDRFSFDEVFVQIANDEVDHFFIMNPVNGDIFAPYDGGVDLIISDEIKRANLFEKHKDWLSSRDDGL